MLNKAHDMLVSPNLCTTYYRDRSIRKGVSWESEPPPLIHNFFFYTVKPPSNRHFGTNINKWILPCIEVVLIKRFRSHYIDRRINFGYLVLSIVERYIIQCPFIGGYSLRGSTVQHLIIEQNRYVFSNTSCIVCRCILCIREG